MKIHELKCWPDFYDLLIQRVKGFEVRRNDRDFKVGDHLLLQEWNPELGDLPIASDRCWEQEPKGYTGREVLVRVGYIMDLGEPFKIAPGYVVLGIKFLLDNE